MSTETLAARRPALDPARIRAWLPAYGVYAAIVLLVLYNVLFTPNFLTWSNVRIQLIQVAPIIIVALGMALVIGTEGIDLSVGSVMALAAALLPLYLGYGLLPALVRSEEHTSELQSPCNLVCRLLLEKKKNKTYLYF